MLDEKDLQAIGHLLEPIKREITEVQLTLENETNKKINIIAEGHLDLTRKLDEEIA